MNKKKLTRLTKLVSVIGEEKSVSPSSHLGLCWLFPPGHLGEAMASTALVKNTETVNTQV